MVETRARKIYVNLAVRDLEKARDFFSRLGFSFDPGFSNDQAACMIVSADAVVMLLTEPFFKIFTARRICDTTTQTEALIAVSCGSRAEVDAMVQAATASGGQAAMPPQDHGFMYSASFYDLDGHHWEAVWMDLDAVR
jgi:predicted lactoylglutathione lyase